MMPARLVKLPCPIVHVPYPPHFHEHELWAGAFWGGGSRLPNGHRALLGPRRDRAGRPHPMYEPFAVTGISMSQNSERSGGSLAWMDITLLMVWGEPSFDGWFCYLVSFGLVANGLIYLLVWFGLV